MKVNLPREVAFSVRNRLNLKGIPYKEVKIEEIEVEQKHYSAVLKIVKDLEKIN